MLVEENKYVQLRYSEDNEPLDLDDVEEKKEDEDEDTDDDFEEDDKEDDDEEDDEEEDGWVS